MRIHACFELEASLCRITDKTFSSNSVYLTLSYNETETQLTCGLCVTKETTRGIFEGGIIDFASNRSTDQIGSPKGSRDDKVAFTQVEKSNHQSNQKISQFLTKLRLNFVSSGLSRNSAFFGKASECINFS